MPTAEAIFSDFLFSLVNISALQVLDIVLVALVFFVLLNLLRRSRATVLLRGMLVLLALFFIVAVFLPLPTFDYILELALLATIIAIPIIFQPELRRLLEELGRRAGTFSLQRAAAETALNPVFSTIENLASQRIGALIVLEGNDDLGDIVQTGVAVGSNVSSELLQTIFYDGTPLHDGAVIIRGNRVLAAGCVLPVSNRSLYAGQRRLGTRHRAALGLAEISDALVLVASEETGAISVAHDGRLQTNLEKTALREQIHKFYRRDGVEEDRPVWRQLWTQFRQWLRSALHLPRGDELLPTLSLMLLSVLMALATWSFVIQETNPIREVRIDNVPLALSDVPQHMTLQADPPDSVSVVVKAPNAIIDSLGAGSFRAQVSLQGLEPDLHRIPVDVDASARPVQIVSVTPAEVDIQLVQIISRTVAVRLDENSLLLPSPALELSGAPVFTPTEVIVSGAAPRVSSVAFATVDAPDLEATGTVQQMQSVDAVDGDGLVVSDVQLNPPSVMVGLTLAQRTNARDVGVRVITEGTLPDGYRLASLLTEPARVTLLGSTQQLNNVGPAIETVPLDLSQVVDDFVLQLPIDLPPGMEAIDPQGETVRAVVVTVDVQERIGNRVVTRTVELEGAIDNRITFDPSTVEIVLNGPVPLLDEIEAQPELLRAVVDVAQFADLPPGQSTTVLPTVIAPDGVRTRVTPARVEVSVP